MDDCDCNRTTELDIRHQELTNDYKELENALSGDKKAWLIFGCTVMVCLTAVIVSCNVRAYYETKAAFENGYQETALPGTDIPRWNKAR
jgi:hypothetical protein